MEKENFAKPASRSIIEDVCINCKNSMYRNSEVGKCFMCQKTGQVISGDFIETCWEHCDTAEAQKMRDSWVHNSFIRALSISHCNSERSAEQRRLNQEEAERLIEKFKTNAYVEDNVVRWTSNDRVPPTDILELWSFVGLLFSFSKTIEMRDQEVQKSLEEYREARKEIGWTAEEIMEMRSVYGPGEVVVDVITGEKIQL